MQQKLFITPHTLSTPASQVSQEDTEGDGIGNYGLVQHLARLPAAESHLMRGVCCFVPANHTAVKRRFALSFLSTFFYPILILVASRGSCTDFCRPPILLHVTCIHEFMDLLNGNIGIMEKKMETTIMGYTGV